MEAQHGHSKACCNIPPIAAEGYKEKGKYETIGGLKTYVTGSSSATKAILFIFDIFGYYPQTLQGADILAVAGKEHDYQVFMPDWFEGKPADISWFPPQNKEQEEKLGNFFQTTGAPPKTVAKIPETLKAIQKEYPNIKTWGIAGFCWGGKIVSLTSGSDTAFTAAAECHPAMVDPSDAEKITIPLCVLASKDESADDIKKFEASLKVPKYVETYPDQIHGWMGARGDLKDPKCLKEYERGYSTLLSFFQKHL